MTTSWAIDGCWWHMFSSRLLISSADKASSKRGRSKGLPAAVAVRVRLVERWEKACGGGRAETEGDAVGDADMRSSWSSSLAFLLRPDILSVLKGSECGGEERLGVARR